MIRILLLLVPVMLIYWAIRWLQKTPAEQISGRIKKNAWLIAALLLLLLALTGKLNTLLALLGVALAFIVRLLPAILHYAPQLHRLWLLYVTGKQAHQEQSGRDDRQSPPRRRGSTMTKAEALEVLGLKPGASDEAIIQAHRKLISRLHPDRGGSDYLAAQINLAKKTLLAG